MFDLSELPRPIVRYGAGIWRRRWLIVAIAWVLAIMGWIGVYLLPDHYQSQAHVVVQEALVDPLLNDVAARPNYERRVEVLRLSLTTFPNVEQMVYRAGLDTTIVATSALDRQAQLERLVRGVASSIRIDSPRPMYFIITYGHGDPEIAKKVVDAAVNILIEQDLGASLRENENSEEKLRASIEEYNQILSSQEREIAEYRRLNADELVSTLSTEQGRERRRAELTVLTDTISATRQTVETLRARLALTPRVTTGGELESMKVRLAQLRSQYNDNYPDIQNLLEQIARLESEDSLPDNPVFIQVSAELQGANDRLRALEAREAKLRAEVEAEALSASQAPQVVAELQRLERNYRETQSRLSRLVATRDSLALRKTLDNGGQGLDYTVVEPPRKALVPVDPPRTLLILAVIVLAFGAGGALALGLTFIDRTYTQAADLENAFKLPVLGGVGQVLTPKRQRAQWFDFIRLVGACGAIFIAGFLYIYVAVWHPQANLLNGDGTGDVASLMWGEK